MAEENSFLKALSQSVHLEFPVGEGANGQFIKSDLNKINHLLIAGASGTGKSVFADTILLTLIANNSSDKVALLLCDTKGTEFTQYNCVSNMLTHSCSGSRIPAVLSWLDIEISRRLKLLSQVGVKDLSTYNDYLWQSFSDELPCIVLVVDDISVVLHDYPEAQNILLHILTSGRATGIHIVAITQTPAVKQTKAILQGFFSKATFQLSTQSEYRLITGKRSVPLLNSSGDMLFCLGPSVTWVHGYMPSSADIANIIGKATDQITSYNSEITEYIERRLKPDDNKEDSENDPLLLDAISIVVERGEASSALLQHKLRIGYARASKLIGIMEEKGIIGPFDGIKPHKVLITPIQWADMLNKIKAKD